MVVLPAAGFAAPGLSAAVVPAARDRPAASPASSRSAIRTATRADMRTLSGRKHHRGQVRPACHRVQDHACASTSAVRRRRQCESGRQPAGLRNSFRPDTLAGTAGKASRHFGGWRPGTVLPRRDRSGLTCRVVTDRVLANRVAADGMATAGLPDGPGSVSGCTAARLARRRRLAAQCRPCLPIRARRLYRAQPCGVRHASLRHAHLPVPDHGCPSR